MRLGGFPRPTDLVDAEALADMRAFNDLKAKRKKQRKRKIVVGIVSAVAVLAVAGGAFAWYSADQAAKALENMAPQNGLRRAGHVRRNGVGFRQPAARRLGERHVRG